MRAFEEVKIDKPEHIQKVFFRVHLNRRSGQRQNRSKCVLCDRIPRIRVIKTIEDYFDKEARVLRTANNYKVYPTKHTREYFCIAHAPEETNPQLIHYIKSLFGKRRVLIDELLTHDELVIRELGIMIIEREQNGLGRVLF